MRVCLSINIGRRLILPSKSVTPLNPPPSLYGINISVMIRYQFIEQLLNKCFGLMYFSNTFDDGKKFTSPSKEGVRFKDDYVVNSKEE